MIRRASLSCLAMLCAALACLAARASAQTYGANKILYQPLRWMTANSPHIRLFFYPEESELAQSVLVIAESTCVEYERRLQYKLSDPIPVFVYSSHRDFESTNILPGVSTEDVGGVTELLRGRVLVPHTGSYARLRHVVRHELVHAFMLDQLTTAAHKSRTVLRGTPPLWVVEGWAEHLSGGWTTEDDMVLRTAVLGGQAQELDGLWRIEGSFLMYKEGQSFLDYIAAHVGGSGQVGRMFELWPRKPDMDSVSLQLWGRSLEDWGKEWFRSLRRTYYPMVATRSEASDFATPLLARGSFNLRPCVVPGTSGSRLQVVHFSDQHDYPGVWLWQRKGKRAVERRLVRGGDRRAFESLHFFETRLAVNNRGEVAVVSRQGPRDVLHILRLDGGGRVATLESPELISLSSPSWSAGGDSLVVRGQDLSGRADLYLVERQSGRWTPLMRDLYDDYDPVFSPDGGVTFCSDRSPDGPDGRAHLFQRTPDGTIRALTSGPSTESEPAWSPDGRRLLFVSDRGGVHDLFVMEAGRGTARLTRIQGAAWDPSWEADSGRLVFSQYAAGRFQMFEMRIVDSALAWTPDSTVVPPATAQLAEWKPPVAPASTPIGAYHRRWGVGLVESQFGTSDEAGGGSGAQLALQDMLGNEEFRLTFNSNGEGLPDLLDNIDIGISYFNLAHRLNYGIGLFRLNEIYDSRFDLILTEHRNGGFLSAMYPMTRFDRLETSLVVRHSENHLFSDGEEGPATLISHNLSLVHDNAWYSGFGITSGWRLLVSGTQTRDLSHTKGNSWDIALEARRYQELLPGTTWVGRVRSEWATGSDVEPIFAGGFGDLPGYSRRAVFGTRLVVANSEVRFPVVRSLVLSLPGGGLGLPPIQSALFVDAAAYGEGEWQGTIGAAGISFYIGGGPLPSLRLDLARLYDGYNWQPGLHSHFGAGFDF